MFTKKDSKVNNWPTPENEKVLRETMDAYFTWKLGVLDIRKNKNLSFDYTGPASKVDKGLLDIFARYKFLTEYYFC